MTREELRREAMAYIDETMGSRQWRWDGATCVRGDTVVVDGKCPTCFDAITPPRQYSIDGSRCSCERAWVRKALDAYLLEHSHGVWPRLWEKADVPARHAGARLSRFEESEGAEVALHRCEAWAESYELGENCGGLYLCGSFGCGKTHLAVATAFRAMERTLVQPLFVSASGLLAKVKSGDVGVSMKPVERAVTSELLIYDDVGQVGRTEFDRDVAYRIVSGRYETNRPTLFTSNLSPDRLGERLGGALASRIHECCELVVLTASDWRKANH